MQSEMDEVYEGQGKEHSGRGMVCAKALGQETLHILEEKKETAWGRGGEGAREAVGGGRTTAGPFSHACERSLHLILSVVSH